MSAEGHQAVTPETPVEEGVVVLVVDDEAIVAEEIERRLRQDAAIEVHLCLEPQKALATALEISPSVVVLDLQMPGIDGMTVVRFLRVHPRTREVPVVMLAPKAEPMTKADAFRNGATDFLIGLPSAVELVARVRQHSRNYRLTQQRDTMIRELSDSRLALREVNRKLSAAMKAKEEFLAKMSHEIRTPLNGVLGVTELLSQTGLDAEQRELLRVIRSSGDALLVLIDDILDFSRIEAGRLPIESVEFGLGNLVDDALYLMSESAEAKGLELASCFGAGVPERVVGDPVRVRQILSNVVGNAIKFTETGGVSVRVGLIEAEGDEARVQFEVRDTGLGIAAGRLGAIFEAFSQADTSITREFGGTGLGLAICKQLAELMGGELSVESTPSKGSVFAWSLRLGLPEAASFEGSGPVSGDPRLEGRPVLVVDDHETSREAAVCQLEAWGMKASGASSALEAMEVLRAAVMTEEPFELALVDLRMPEEDGLDLLAQVGENPSLRSLKTVPMVAMADRSGVAELRRVGIRRFLTKPLSRRTLFRWCLRSVDPTATEETLPVVLEDRAVTPEAGTESVGGWKVLVAEDNPVNQFVVRRMLEGLRCEVTLAANGRVAVSLANERVFDVLLMDCEMPEMDGFAATRAIRGGDGPCARRPILALTAYAMDKDRKRCLAAGMDAVITKPVSQSDLDEALLSWARKEHRAAAAERDTTEDELEIVVEREGSSIDQLEELDLAAIEALVSIGGSELVVSVIDIFLDDAPKHIAEARRGIDEGDLETASRAAHTLKSAAAQIGAHRLSELCRRVEDLCDAGETTSLAVDLGQVDDALAEVTPLLRIARARHME